MKKYLPPICLLIVLLALSITYAVMIHYSAEGYVEVNVLEIEGNTIILGHDCLAIIADTSPERAYSIELGINKKIENRPMTHDSFVEVLKSFNITLEAVKIQRTDDKYYYADMILSDNKKVLTLDVMPSDAIAIALRSNAPIYINQTLLDEVGENIC